MHQHKVCDTNLRTAGLSEWVCKCRLTGRQQLNIRYSHTEHSSDSYSTTAACFVPCLFVPSFTLYNNSTDLIHHCKVPPNTPGHKENMANVWHTPPIWLHTNTHTHTLANAHTPHTGTYAQNQCVAFFKATGERFVWLILSRGRHTPLHMGSSSYSFPPALLSSPHYFFIYSTAT